MQNKNCYLRRILLPSTSNTNPLRQKYCALRGIEISLYVTFVIYIFDNLWICSLRNTAYVVTLYVERSMWIFDALRNAAYVERSTWVAAYVEFIPLYVNFPLYVQYVT